MKALGALVLYQLWKFFVCCYSNEGVWEHVYLFYLLFRVRYGSLLVN